MGPNVGGGAVRALSIFNNNPVYVVNSTFGGATGFGNEGSNGGALKSIGVSYSVLNSVFTHNSTFARNLSCGSRRRNLRAFSSLARRASRPTAGAPCWQTELDSQGAAWGGQAFDVTSVAMCRPVLSQPGQLDEPAVWRGILSNKYDQIMLGRPACGLM